MYGLSLMEFAEKKVEDGKFLIIKANGMTDMKKVKKSPSTYCLGQIDSMYGDRDKGLFVCFQVAIAGTAKQHDIHPNGKRAIKSAREKHLQRCIQPASPNRLVSILRSGMMRYCIVSFLRSVMVRSATLSAMVRPMVRPATLLHKLVICISISRLVRCLLRSVTPCLHPF